MQGAWVQFLVGELRSCMLHVMAIKKKNVNMKIWVMKLLSYDLVVINIQKIDHILKIQLIAANQNLTHFLKFQ